MQIIALSDTHNRHNNLQVPDGDIIIHAGDATNRGQKDEVSDFLKWYGNLPHKHKVFIAGNHDWLFEREPTAAKQLCEDNGIIYLENSGVELEGLKIWGSPITPWFYNWAFNVQRFDPIKKYWDQIPDGLDILITHGPPYKILDQLKYANGDFKAEWVGCEELYKAVLRAKPKVHIFGHIHCGYGVTSFNDTTFFNAAICGETYHTDNDPVIIGF